MPYKLSFFFHRVAPSTRRYAVLGILAISIATMVADKAAAIQAGATQFSLPSGQNFTSAGRQIVAISADGSQFVYAANNRFYVKSMNERDSKVLPGMDLAQNVTNPVFSPDGKHIVFWSGADQTLKRIPVSGGTPQTLCPAANPYGISWGAGDQIVFGQGANGIMRVSANGGTPERIVTVKSGELAHGPEMLPDGNTLLYTLGSNVVPAGNVWDNAKIVVQPLNATAPKILIEGGSDARYAPTGHLVYATAGRLMAVGFDAKRIEVTGKPVALIENVRNAGGTTGTTQFSFSRNGSLIYVSAQSQIASTQRRLSLVDLNGNAKYIRPVPPSTFGPRISPDGKQVAYRAESSVYIADLTSDAPARRLTTTEPGEAPIWSPDGERIAYISLQNGVEALFWRRSDGSGSSELLANPARAPEYWSVVHQVISYITLVGPSGDQGDYDIWTYSLKDKKASPLISIPPSAQSGSRFSPDGKWIAYESNETGRAEVYVEPIPRTTQRYQITKTGGSRPVWSPTGDRLYFDNNTGPATVRLFSSDIQTQPSFKATEPSPLPITGFMQSQGTNRRQFDITPDGKQFLVVFPPISTTPQIDIIPNWFDELKRK